MEANRVVMATSASTASVSCTATTVQSSNNLPKHLSSQRPNTLGDIGGRGSGYSCTDAFYVASCMLSEFGQLVTYKQGCTQCFSVWY